MVITKYNGVFILPYVNFGPLYLLHEACYMFRPDFKLVICLDLISKCCSWHYPVTRFGLPIFLFIVALFLTHFDCP